FCAVRASSTPSPSGARGSSTSLAGAISVISSGTCSRCNRGSIAGSPRQGRGVTDASTANPYRLEVPKRSIRRLNRASADRHARRFVRLAGCYLTADFRPLPDLVILGTQRGGTTSLYRGLVSHPDVAPAMKKEVHYFDDHYH